MDSQSDSSSKAQSGSMLFSNRKTLYIVAVLVIVVVAVVLIWISLQHSGAASISLVSSDNMPVPASLISQITSVPNNVSQDIGIGSAYPIGSQYSSIHVENASPLKAGGKPEILYIGAEYCPFCAAQRWALIMALSRFGTFSGLEYMTSSSSDEDPSTPTFTFTNATYSSPYITFVAVETTRNKQVNGTYPILQVPNASENTTFAAYNTGGSIPFVDFGNKTVEIGATYDPGVLQGMNWSQIADQLDTPSSPQAEGIVGSANLLTAQICSADGNMPQGVCGQAYIKSLEG